jgi:hypothetical protein
VPLPQYRVPLPHLSVLYCLCKLHASGGSRLLLPLLCWLLLLPLLRWLLLPLRLLLPGGLPGEGPRVKPGGAGAGEGATGAARAQRAAIYQVPVALIATAAAATAAAQWLPQPRDGLLAHPCCRLQHLLHKPVDRSAGGTHRRRRRLVAVPEDASRAPLAPAGGEQCRACNSTAQCAQAPCQHAMPDTHSHCSRAWQPRRPSLCSFSGWNWLRMRAPKLHRSSGDIAVLGWGMGQQTHSHTLCDDLAKGPH